MRRRSAFTLIELLVVIAIIAMLALFMTLAISTVFETSRRAQCAGTEASIAKAFATYAVDNGEVLAPTATWQFKVGKYLSIRTTSLNGEPTDKEISASKVMLCASAKNVFGNPDRLYSYARNHEIDVKYDNKPDDAPELIAIKSPSKTMLVIDGAYREGSKDWALLAKYADYKEATSTAYETHRKDGVNVAFVDGRAAWFNVKDLPSDPSKTNTGAHASVYYNQTFWKGLVE